MGFMDDPLWYKDAIIYELHVKAFYDANGDGVGDFRGLIERLDYLEDLGVNTLWLLPFYPSPMRDDGYDIADYHNVHPAYGSRQDVRAFIREVHRRGMRVITELVINHTSDQHAWFQAARRAPKGSVKRDYYVWSDDPNRFAETRIIFTDTESSNWAWDNEAKAYYWHRFFSHQPDLNFDNPQVVKAVLRVMRFWLDMGVDGLRLDAIPYLIEREGTHNENLPETHALIKHIRSVLDTHYQGRMLLAEANQWPEDVREYFGEGDECHMAYHFPIMPRMYMAIAQEDRYPLVDILKQTPDIPSTCQWAIFLRNHDELTLEMVTDRERDYMYQTYAHDPRMRINVGIRRRLAPLLDNDLEKIKLLNCLLMSMPGAPIIYYGDEIGMGDNIFLGDRNGVRTPMQWSPDRNAGFSRADPQSLYLPPVMDNLYGFQAINVEAQTRNHSSLLNWMRRLISVRRAHPGLGRGTLKVLAPGNRKLFAYLRHHDEEDILCVANLSHTPQPVELDLSEHKGCVPVELSSSTVFPPIGDLPYLLTLPRYGFLWFKLSRSASAPVWHTDRPALEDLPILVLTEVRGFFTRHTNSGEEYEDLVAPATLNKLNHQVLPHYFVNQRWYKRQATQLHKPAFEAWGAWQADNLRWLFAVVHMQNDHGATADYFLPLAMKWGVDAREIPVEWLPKLVTRIRRKAEVGVILDAMGDDRFCLTIATRMGHAQEIPLAGGKLSFMPTRGYHEWIRAIDPDWVITRPTLRQSHTSVVLGDRLFLKFFRQLEHGPLPEWEIGRFLTEHTPFDRIPPLLGAMWYQPDVGEISMLAMMHGYLDNQGTAWDYTMVHLGRSLDGVAASLECDHSGYCALMHTAGARLGEFHQALSIPTAQEAFGSEPADENTALGWLAHARTSVARMLDMLADRCSEWGDEERSRAEALLARRNVFVRCFDDFDFTGLAISLTRYHGDFHLGRLLVVQNDVYITGMQGPEDRDIASRHGRHSPLQDVATLLHSLEQVSREARLRLPCDSPTACVQLEQMLIQWLDLARDAFLQGYRKGIGRCRSYPVEMQHASELIELFTLLRRASVVRQAMHGGAEAIARSLQELEAWLALAQRG